MCVYVCGEETPLRLLNSYRKYTRSENCMRKYRFYVYLTRDT